MQITISKVEATILLEAVSCYEAILNFNVKAVASTDQEKAVASLKLNILNDVKEVFA